MQGPRPIRALRLEDPELAQLEVIVIPFSGAVGDFESELSLSLRHLFEKVIILEDHPSTVITLNIHIQALDGSVAATAINAGILALCDAGVPLRAMVSAITVGKLSKIPIIDQTTSPLHQLLDAAYDAKHKDSSSKDIKFDELDASFKNAEGITIVDLNGKEYDEIQENNNANQMYQRRPKISANSSTFSLYPATQLLESAPTHNLAVTNVASLAFISDSLNGEGLPTFFKLVSNPIPSSKGVLIPENYDLGLDDSDVSDLIDTGKKAASIVLAFLRIALRKKITQEAVNYGQDTVDVITTKK